MLRYADGMVLHARAAADVAQHEDLDVLITGVGGRAVPRGQGADAKEVEVPQGDDENGPRSHGQEEWDYHDLLGKNTPAATCWGAGQQRGLGGRGDVGEVWRWDG